jgi:hypothetical protein
VTVKGPFGQKLHEATQLQLPELLPGNSVEIAEPFKGLPPFGPVSATASVVAGDVRASASGTAWVVPWLAVVIVVALVVGLVIYRRRRRPFSDPPREVRERELVGAPR